MTISVLLPNYNHGRFLTANFEAILAQTYPDWELIVVDDASTDHSPALIASYAARDPRIRPIFSPVNQGAVAASLASLAAAQGDLVYASSADDRVSDPHFFEAVTEALRAYPEAAGAFGRSTVVDAQTEALLWEMGCAPHAGYLSPRESAEAFFASALFIPGIAAVWRRDQIDRLGGYDPALGPQCDYFLNHALAMLEGVVFLTRTVAVTRHSHSSYSQATSDAEFGARHAHVERRFHQLPLAYDLDPAWIRLWRGNLTNARLAATTQRRAIELLRASFAEIVPWQEPGLPKRFVDLRQTARTECDRLEAELRENEHLATQIFEAIAGPCPIPSDALGQIASPPPFNSPVGSTPSPITPVDLIETARQALDAGDAETAERHLRLAVEALPEERELRIAYGNVLLSLNRHEPARLQFVAAANLAAGGTADPTPQPEPTACL